MVEPGEGADEAILAVAARHALHDEELVAAFATGSVDDDGDRSRAQQLVDRCAACRDLRQDLEAIGGAIRASASHTAAAPRDFRLSVEDAIRLGGTVRTRGVLGRLRRAFADFARPLGASMVALGIAGLLVGSATFGGYAASPLAVDTAVTQPTSATEVNAGAARSSAPGASQRSAYQPGSTFEEGTGDGGDPPPSEREAGASAGASAWLLGGSAGLLAAGLILLAMTFRRGRSRDSAS